MTKAKHMDKPLVVDILVKAFNNNKSVNYIIKQDIDRERRIKKLMEYSFEICHRFGNIFITPDRKGCALLIDPSKKRTTITSALLDINLVLSSLGLFNIKRALNRERQIKKFHPKHPYCYLWFIGVDPAFQNKGIGSALLQHILKNSNEQGRPVYLETSTVSNLSWYKANGFEIYHELDLSYKLYLLRKEVH